jgi:NAD(P)-dependent dehydrogenase (short-subunit alcohol dehydrogenase family)
MPLIALVTGVGRAEGIGYEVCRQLAARDMTVILTARNAATAASLAAELAGEVPGRVVGLELDVADRSSVNQAADQVLAQFGTLDILINNAAGAATYGEMVATADLAAARAMFEATFFGTWNVAQAMLPLLKTSPEPRIVNVSSGAGSHGDKVFGLTSRNAMGPSYASAKAAINALTATLARELDGRFRVNAVCPGFTATFPDGEKMGARPVVEGAKGIVWAATLPSDGPTGGLFRDGQPLPW